VVKGSFTRYKTCYMAGNNGSKEIQTLSFAYLEDHLSLIHYLCVHGSVTYSHTCFRQTSLFPLVLVVYSSQCPYSSAQLQCRREKTISSCRKLDSTCVIQSVTNYGSTGASDDSNSNIQPIPISFENSSLLLTDLVFNLPHLGSP